MHPQFEFISVQYYMDESSSRFGNSHLFDQGNTTVVPGLFFFNDHNSYSINFNNNNIQLLYRKE